MHGSDSAALEGPRPRVLICEDEGIVATDIGLSGAAPEPDPDPVPVPVPP